MASATKRKASRPGASRTPPTKITPINKKPPTPDVQGRALFREQLNALSECSLEAIECRANGHGPWRPRTVTKIQFGYHLWELCDNCKSERERWLDRYGLVAKQSKIHYSEVFELLRGLGHNTGIRRGAARIEYMSRHNLPELDLDD